MAFGRKQTWFWCQEHQRAEEKKGACARDRRLGPYPSKEAAENWKATFEARNEAWKEQDEAWAAAGTASDDADASA